MNKLLLMNKIFLISLLLVFKYGQECDSGFVWIEDVPSCCGAPAEHCFFESDLSILQHIIDNSASTINLLMDDNENGEVEPIELGMTEWVNGRIIALDCYLSNIMNCNLSGELPDNFGELDSLEALWLNDNNFSGEIPESFSNLENLELLYLAGNNFSGMIPESFCELNVNFSGTNNWDVEYFNIENNSLCPPYPTCLDSEIIGEQSCIDFLGDMNFDSSLNILDIVFIANLIIQGADYNILADLNQDNQINILDIINLSNIIINN